MARSNTTLVPTAGLEVAPYGILSPATTLYEESQTYWTSGFTYEIEDAGVVGQFSGISGFTGTPPTSSLLDADPANKDRFKTYYPFDIQTSVKVSTFGTTPSEIEERATKALSIMTQKAVEVEF